MSDILIKNMEMPRGNNVLVVDSAGTITKVNRWTGKVEATDPFSVKAIGLPDHGRCIDADQMQDVLRLVLSLVVSNELTEKEISLVHRTIGAISEAINDLDTVLEANYGTDN